MVGQSVDTRIDDFMAKVIELIKQGQREKTVEMLHSLESIQLKTIALQILVANASVAASANANAVDRINLLSSALNTANANAAASALANATATALSSALDGDPDNALALADVHSLALASEFVYVIIRVLNPTDSDTELLSALKTHL